MNDSESHRPVVDVTLHIDETLDETELLALEQTMRNAAGIVSVGHSDKDRHLMVVLYNPTETKSINILHSLASQGYHGELVGL